MTYALITLPFLAAVAIVAALAAVAVRSRTTRAAGSVDSRVRPRIVTDIALTTVAIVVSPPSSTT